jgi:hypothetical protein
MNTNIEGSKTNPVSIAILVKAFKEVLGGGKFDACRDTTYSMKLLTEDPRVVIRGDNIYIRRPGATIDFIIRSPADNIERYYPVGISFFREGEPSADDFLRLGLLNFPQDLTKLKDRVISITDSYRDDAPHIRYKFSVVIQRGSDGQIGIIDPGIVHEDD